MDFSLLSAIVKKHTKPSRYHIQQPVIYIEILPWHTNSAKRLCDVYVKFAPFQDTEGITRKMKAHGVSTY
jgi:hypothetical protein